MVEIPDHIKGIIALYNKRLEENLIPVSQAILFGSYAGEIGTDTYFIQPSNLRMSWVPIRRKRIFPSVN